MIFFTGDINLTDWDFNQGFGIGTNISHGLDPFRYISRENDDLWVGNFEGVCSSTTTKQGVKAEVFRVEPEAIRKLKHFDIYGFANNHAMQHGHVAYQETVDTLESVGCVVFGTSMKHSCILDYNGREVSITGMCMRVDEFEKEPSYWYNPEYIEIESEIKQLPSDAFKILFVHWGNEYINRPSIAQRKFAHWLIDAGFDLIIGMHPHVLQGFEDYKGKRIYYSLGNFVFDMASEPCKLGAIVGLDLENDRVEFVEKYVKIDADCCPHIIDPEDVPTEWQFDYLNSQLLKEDNSEQYHQDIQAGYAVYRKANHKYILKNMMRHPKRGWYMLKDFISRRLIG